MPQLMSDVVAREVRRRRLVDANRKVVSARVGRIESRIDGDAAAAERHVINQQHRNAARAGEGRAFTEVLLVWRVMPLSEWIAFERRQRASTTQQSPIEVELEVQA